MNNIYFPPDSPHLSDSLYIQYGFFTGSSTQFQRTQAYRMAQSMVEQHIGTFIIPRTVTGTYSFIQQNYVIDAGIGKINSVDSVVFHERWTGGQDRYISGTARLIDAVAGYFLAELSENDNSVCNGCGSPQGIYQVEVALNIGYQTGILVNNPFLELALCMVTDIVLPIMFDQGIAFEYWDFDKTVQVGRTIKTVSDRFLYETVFGHSSKAMFIRDMLKPYSIRPAKKFS